MQDLSWKGKPQSYQQEECEDEHEAEGNKSQDDQKSQASEVESEVSLQGFPYSVA